ncbi:hypothetical protein PR202_gb02968 [Eleusine coracana subsp. coracana]|uniref:C2H2-type domain-containing protein n=1 Tax=Eleusine coracana subsp. coracana TaxID=191504 RepID=A0AAV5DYF4_ELECO|nr:hypothetical protein PR202_gb02968 [Eleusine coracana subsp. coracana]
MSDRDAREEKKTSNASAAASIDAFSQLPFVRPSAAREKPQPPPGIRLFGFDVPPDAAATSPTTTGVANKVVVEESTGTTSSAETAAGGDDGEPRKFECQYCCRNFPTSQALGGHQNAHKRERQHAKRAQFQTAMAMHHHHGNYYYHPADPAAAHLYAAAYRNHHHRFSAAPPPPPPHYPSWAGAAAGRYNYTGPGSISQPITGSPVAPSAMWRVPLADGGVGTPTFTARRADWPVAPPDLPPVLGGSEDQQVVMVSGAGCMSFSPSTSSSSSSPSPHRRPPPPEHKENVSLDLSL